MPVAYPFNLRTIIRTSKSRSQPAAFQIAQPRRGYGYVEPIGTDRPVFWDVTFRFTTAEAATFKTWFDSDLQEGILEFTMPIRTEYGLVTHTCQFMPDGLLDARELGEVWEYRAQIMSRSLIGATLPSGFDDNAIFTDEGISTTGWSASNGTMSSASGYVRLTKGATGGTPGLATKSLGGVWVGTSKDWILYGKFRASRGANHCGAIWFLNNGDPISPDANAAIWFGSTNASTGGYSDTALSIVCTTSGGTVRNTASLGTGYAYDATPVEFALHYCNKWSRLHCYVKQTDGTWLWEASVAGEFFAPPDIQMAVASTAPSGAYVEADYLSQCRPNFVAIGDSICEGKIGFSPDPALALTDPATTWQRYFNGGTAYPSLRNTLVVNKGVGGQSSAQIDSRLAADVTSHSPRVVFLHASTNDTVASITLAARSTNIQNSANTIAAAGASCVLLNAMYGTSSNSLNPGLQAYMADWWANYRLSLSNVSKSIDIMQPLLSGGYMATALTESDNIHPKAAGYELIGELITSEA